MAIVNRVSRLFRADINAVLDRLEEPDLLLRQAILDMEEVVQGLEERLRVQTQERSQLAARRSEQSEGIASINDELDLCFEAGKETLARTLLRRRLVSEGLVRQFDKRIQMLEASLAEMRQQMEDQRARLEAMRARAAVFQQDDAGDSSRESDGFNVQVSDEDVELAWLRERARRQQ